MIFMAVPKYFMNMLVCPKCKEDVEEKDMFIVCRKCQLAYPVLDRSVPDMLIEDAWELEKAEKENFKHMLRL